MREATNGDMYAKVMQLTKENERLQAELDAIMAQVCVASSSLFFLEEGGGFFCTVY